MEAWLSAVRRAIERCVVDRRSDIERVIQPLSERWVARQPNLSHEATAALAEAEVLRVRAEVAALDAAAAEKRLRRTVAIAASTLFDVRQRATMRVCFAAISAAGAQHAAEQRKPSRPVWPFGPASTSASRGGRRHQWQDHGPQAQQLAVTRPPEPACTGAEGGSSAAQSFRVEHDENLFATPPRTATLARPSFPEHMRMATTGMSGGGASAAGAHYVVELETRSSSHALSPGGPLSAATAVSGGPMTGNTVGQVSWQARATASALELAEAEGLHDLRVEALVGTLNRSHTRLARTCARLRDRHALRLCLHALRAYAAWRCAARGRRARAVLSHGVCDRRLLRVLLTAWRLHAVRASELRSERQAVAEVVGERLALAEDDFAELRCGVLERAVLLRERVAVVVGRRAHQRLLASCWLALRLWAAHQRLLGERQAWRDLFRSIRSESRFRGVMDRHGIASPEAGTGSPKAATATPAHDSPSSRSALASAAAVRANLQRLEGMCGRASGSCASVPLPASSVQGAHGGSLTPPDPANPDPTGDHTTP